jgi:hypothetical protein
MRYGSVAVGLLVLASLATPALAVGDGKAKLIGTTVEFGVKEKSEAPINLKGDEKLVFGNGQFELPWSSVQDVEYGQKVGHRIGTAILISPVALFKKARHHYVTLAYKDAAGKDQAVVFEFGKGDIRMALATLKARTGKEITFQDDNARKQMGGGLAAPAAPAGETKQ